MYVHMLLCTSTPTSRHVAPPLDLGGVVGHVLDPPPPLSTSWVWSLKKAETISLLSRPLMFHHACSFSYVKVAAFFSEGGGIKIYLYILSG